MLIIANSNEDVSLEQEFQEKWKGAVEDFFQTTKGERLDTGCPITPRALADLFRSKTVGSSDQVDSLADAVWKIGKSLLSIGKLAASIGSFVSTVIHIHIFTHSMIS